MNFSINDGEWRFKLEDERFAIHNNNLILSKPEIGSLFIYLSGNEKKLIFHKNEYGENSGWSSSIKPIHSAATTGCYYGTMSFQEINNSSIPVGEIGDMFMDSENGDLIIRKSDGWYLVKNDSKVKSYAI
jgi:hypothetical protein